MFLFRACAVAALAAGLMLGGAAADEPPPSPIHANQVGFEPAGAKVFVVSGGGRAGLRWSLRDASGSVVTAGQASITRPAPQAGGVVTTIAINRVLPPGSYTLDIAGIGIRPFTVSQRPFRSLFRDAMSFFYQQRAGIAITPAFVPRPDLSRPAGHPDETASCFTGTDWRGVRWPGCAQTVRVAGGWYDAGDRGKYGGNGAISVWTLLDAYERRSAGKGRDLMGDNALRLPEAGNGVPDLLDEARWEVEWMLRMQLPPGTQAAVLAPDGRQVHWVDGAGLVYNKVADTVWAKLPLRVEDDHGVRALYPPSTAATLDFAAVTAQAARIWRGIDPAFADRCLLAARRAFAAAAKHPDLIADDRFTGSGGYGDRDVRDERFWAATELAITAGDEAALDAMVHSPYAKAEAVSAPGWNMVAGAATVSALEVPNHLPRAFLADQRRALLTSAARLVAEDAAQPYSIPTPPTPPTWGSNGALLDNAILLGAAFDVSGDAAFRSASVDAIDYVLGRNPLDRSFVTGYGVRPMRHPHHRFWANSLDPSFPTPPPGVLSGGPNSTVMTDPVARAMAGGCLPQLCWVDDARAYTQNEVALNWNAPLVWVAAFLDSTRAF